jgi:hypothetical protein
VYEGSVRRCSVTMSALFWRRLAMVLAAGCLLLAACQPAPSSQAAGLNVARKAGLAGARQLEILEQGATAADNVSRAVITDQATLRKLAALLDTPLPLGPRARCLGRYLLRFDVQGRIEEFEYYCQEGTSFLRGGQEVWQGKQGQPPAEVDALVRSLLPQ